MIHSGNGDVHEADYRALSEMALVSHSTMRPIGNMRVFAALESAVGRTSGLLADSFQGFV